MNLLLRILAGRKLTVDIITSINVHKFSTKQDVLDAMTSVASNADSTAISSAVSNAG